MFDDGFDGFFNRLVRDRLNKEKAKAPYLARYAEVYRLQERVFLGAHGVMNTSDDPLNQIPEPSFRELVNSIANACSVSQYIDVKPMRIRQLLSEGSCHGPDEALADSCIMLALVPYFHAFRKEVIDAPDSGDACPVCGQKPYLATIDEGGARHLHCWLCGHSWAFPRLTCPNCGNNKQDRLGYFYPPGDRSSRVQVCHECNTYIKTFVFSDAGETFLPLKDLLTIGLDLAAEREGFQKCSQAARTLYFAVFNTTE